MIQQWRVNERGIFRGTLRIAKFDFDTDPCEDYRQSVYKEMSLLLNSDDKVVGTLREIDKIVGGKELAHMPVPVAKLLVRLKKWIQDIDSIRP